MEKIKVIIYDDPSETSFPLSLSLKNIKTKVKLLHFSRSPNLSAPSSLPSFKYTNRRTWILQNIFNGIFDHVIWFHPNKSKSHLKDRFTSNYFIGLDKNQLTTDIPDPYFYNSGEFSCSNHMRNRSNFRLSVTKIHEFNTSCSVCVELSSGLLSQPFALHIDLSLFCSNSQNSKGLEDIVELNRIYRLYAPPNPPDINLSLNSPATEVIDYGLKMAQIINDERRNQMFQLEQIINWIVSADDLKWEDATSMHNLSNCSNTLLISVHEVYDTVILLRSYLPKYIALTRRLEKIARDCLRIIEKYSTNKRISMPQILLTKKSCDSNPSSPTITDADWFQSSQTCLSIKEFSMKLHKCFFDCSNRYANIEHENIADNPENIMNCIESTMNRFYNPSIIILSRQNASLPEASSHHTLLHLSRQQQTKKNKPLSADVLSDVKSAGIKSSNNDYSNNIQTENSDRLFSAQLNAIKMLSRIYGKKNLTFELNYPSCLEDAKKLQALGYEAVGIDQPHMNKLLSGTNSLSEFSFDWSIDDETEAELSTFEWSISQKKESSSGRDNPNILSSQDANNSFAVLEPGRKEIL